MWIITKTLLRFSISVTAVKGVLMLPNRKLSIQLTSSWFKLETGDMGGFANTQRFVCGSPAQ
jgi:hypothetical protein